MWVMCLTSWYAHMSLSVWWPLTRVQVATTKKVTYVHISLLSTLPTSLLCISIMFAPCFHQHRINFAQSVQIHQNCIFHFKYISILDATYMGTLTKAWGTRFYNCMSVLAKWPLVRIQVTTFTNSSTNLPNSFPITFGVCSCKNSKKHASSCHSSHQISHFRVRNCQIAYLMH